MSKRPLSSKASSSITRGIIIYTDNTPIGFGKTARMSLETKTKFNKLAWPKSKKSDYEYSTLSLKKVNKKHENAITANPIMNS